MERRIDPFIRPRLAVPARPAVRSGHGSSTAAKDEAQLAEERIQPDERHRRHVKSFLIICASSGPGNFERGSNTKTHGIVREFTVHDTAKAHAPRYFANPTYSVGSLLGARAPT
jgi:hypothetical protein